MLKEIPYPDYDPTEEQLLLMCDWIPGKNCNLVKPNPTWFADAAITRFYPKSFKGKLYLFDHDKRIYYEETNTIKQWARHQIKRIAKMITKPVVRPATPEEIDSEAPVKADYYSFPQAQKLDSFLKDVYTQVVVGEDVVIEGDKFPFNQYNGIAVKNGVIEFDDLGTPVLKTRTHHHMFTRYIHVNYEPTAETTKVIEVLKQWLPGGEGEYKWLIQIFAQALFQSLPGISPFKQSYLLLGKPNSGKTSYSNLLLKMVGEENFATHMLHELGDNFIVATLPYKMFNFGDDLPFIKIDASNKFKTLTGKRTMIVNPKFGRPYEADITAVFAFSANYAPELNQQVQEDSGWWDRWAILNFRATGFQKDPTWEERTFTKEFLEGMLLLAILEVGSIIENHGKLNLRQDPDEVKRIWVSDAQLFKEMFFDKFLVITDDDDHWIEPVHLKESIEDFLKGNFYSAPTGMTDAQFKEQMPKSVNLITNALRKLGVYKDKNVKYDGRSLWPYFNLRWSKDACVCEWCHYTDKSMYKESDGKK